MENSVLRDRIAGSLYGLLVGDALGCPVEGWSPGQIQKEYGVLCDMEEARKRWRPKGLHSDDGQQMLMVCDSLLATPDAPSTAFASALVSMFRGGTKRPDCYGLHRGTGMNFRRTVRALRGGCQPHEAAQPSAGNGSAMMISPVGLYWRDDERQLISAAVDIAMVKQSDIRGIAAAGTVAWLTAFALMSTPGANLPIGRLLDAVQTVEEIASEATGSPAHLHVFSEALADMLEHVEKPKADVLKRIAEVAQKTSQHTVYPCSGYAPASVVTSIYVFLTAPSFRESLIEIVNLGGDADTTGAIVGALAGARYGRNAIPADWYGALLARDQLEDRVEGLCERPKGWVPGKSLIRLESRWCSLYD